MLKSCILRHHNKTKPLNRGAFLYLRTHQQTAWRHAILVLRIRERRVRVRVRVRVPGILAALNLDASIQPIGYSDC